MAQLQLDHMALQIYDAAATRAFYGDFLGLPLVSAMQGEDWGGRAWLMMIFGLGDGREIALVELKGDPKPAAREPRDLPHFAFAAADHAALDAWIAKLKSAGLDHWEETHGAQRSVYFPDPNGLMLEITAPPSKASAASARADAIVQAWNRAAARN